MKHTIRTETGTAVLFPDGSMFLDNAGYIRLLTPEQVKAAWNNEPTLPTSLEDYQNLKESGFTDEEIKNFEPFFDGDFWDFGDDIHVIPKLEDFTSNH